MLVPLLKMAGEIGFELVLLVLISVSVLGLIVLLILTHTCSFECVSVCGRVYIYIILHADICAAFSDIGYLPRNKIDHQQSMHDYSFLLLILLLLFFPTTGESSLYIEILQGKDAIAAGSSVPDGTSSTSSVMLPLVWPNRKQPKQRGPYWIGVSKEMNCNYGTRAQKWASLWSYPIILIHYISVTILSSIFIYNCNSNSNLSLNLN